MPPELTVKATITRTDGTRETLTLPGQIVDPATATFSFHFPDDMFLQPGDTITLEHVLAFPTPEASTITVHVKP